MTEENKDKGQDVNADDKGDDKNKDKGNMIPKMRLDQEIGKRKEAEEALNEIAKHFKMQVPEDFQDLVPDLPPVQLIRWIQDANAKGLFLTKSAESLDKKRPNDKKPTDLSGMTPHQMMSQGYQTK